MTAPVQRLSAERLAEIRAADALTTDSEMYADCADHMRRELLAELDAVRAERDEARRAHEYRVIECANLRAEAAQAREEGRREARGLSGPEAYKLNLAYERTRRACQRLRAACATLIAARYRDGECDAVALSTFAGEVDEIVSSEHLERGGDAQEDDDYDTCPDH